MLKDLAGTNQTLRIRGGTGTYNGVIGTRVQVGQGSIAPARTDFKIGTAFANGGIEDGIVNVAGAGGFNLSLGLITISTNISPTAGSGTVTETAMFERWRSLAAGDFDFLVSRDIISPGVSFVATKSITVDYLWQI